MEESGEYKAIYVNKALKTAGLEGTQRPDIIGIYNDGRVELWEFASPSQASGTPLKPLKDKLDLMASVNGNCLTEFVGW